MLAARMFGMTPNCAFRVWLMIGSLISSWGNVQKYLRRAMSDGGWSARAHRRVRPASDDGQDASHHKHRGACKVPGIGLALDPLDAARGVDLGLRVGPVVPGAIEHQDERRYVQESRGEARVRAGELGPAREEAEALGRAGEDEHEEEEPSGRTERHLGARAEGVAQGEEA